MKPDDCPRSERLFEVGMPIGNLTSQETANLFLDRLDQFCKHVLHLHFYVRYMDDFCIYVKGKENAKRIFALISEFLRNELHLDISPKSRIQKATAPVEFVGYMLTPHGIRMRKKTTKHIKRSLKHIMAGYAVGVVSYEKAIESAVCYIGMCKHCNGYNMLRWIQDHFVLQRSDNMNTNDMPPSGRRFYSIHENEDGSVDVYLRPDVLPKTADGQTDYDVAVLVVKDVEPFAGMEDHIQEHFDDWCADAEVIFL